MERRSSMCGLGLSVVSAGAGATLSTGCSSPIDRTPHADDGDVFLGDADSLRLIYPGPGGVFMIRLPPEQQLDTAGRVGTGRMLEDIAESMRSDGMNVEITPDDELRVAAVMSPSRYPSIAEAFIMHDAVDEIRGEFTFAFEVVDGQLAGWTQSGGVEAVAPLGYTFNELVRPRVNLFDLRGTQERLVRVYAEVFCAPIFRSGYIAAVEMTGGAR